LIESIVLGELANMVFNDSLIPKLVKGYHQYLIDHNKESNAIQDLLCGKIADLKRDMDSIMGVIIKTSSDALVAKLNTLDGQKQELLKKLHKIQDDSNIKGPSAEELTYAFRQAKEMLRTGQLPTVKALIERYVHKVIVTDKNIEVQFNLNLSSRVVIYPADLNRQKEIPQPSNQSITEVFTFVPTKMLATGGGAGGS